MRYVYQVLGQRFMLTINDNLLTEASIGEDANNLYYPAISTCTGLAVLLADDTLLGAHFDKGLDSFDVYIMLQRLSEMQAGRAVLAMAVFGNLTYGEARAKCFMAKPDFGNGRMFQTFAEAFDFQGVVRHHDQGGAANRHYRVQAVGGGNWAIHSCPVPSLNGTPVRFDPYGVAWMAQPLV